MKFVADTCWFIDQTRRSQATAAWLRDRPTVRLYVSHPVIAELIAGGRSASSVMRITYGASPLPIDTETAEIWGREQRRLKAAGTPIGINDLWIAAIALRWGLPVFTRNVGEFGRVNGLTVETYAD